ncbi:hypothetical protein GCM10011391_25880 [Pullulanibacillus camelliae]|uniref:Uncharacterized protein n=1 Tax=Pullulanibacillus camelliae TaxID=1707096 RepID=A0A8J2YJ34_9BACL|nr:hypothetical protein GCM10011391_25880 [Pullulanibacillus camelliae]
METPTGTVRVRRTSWKNKSSISKFTEVTKDDRLKHHIHVITPKRAHHYHPKE